MKDGDWLVEEGMGWKKGGDVNEKKIINKT